MKTTLIWYSVQELFPGRMRPYYPLHPVIWWIGGDDVLYSRSRTELGLSIRDSLHGQGWAL